MRSGSCSFFPRTRPPSWTSEGAVLTRCQEGRRIQEGGQRGDSTERGFGQKGLESGLPGWVLQEEEARSGAAEGPREKPVYRRGRPHACQGLQLGCLGLGRAGGAGQAGREAVGRWEQVSRLQQQLADSRGSLEPG